jgi:hypothetical protein
MVFMSLPAADWKNNIIFLSGIHDTEVVKDEVNYVERVRSSTVFHKVYLSQWCHQAAMINVGSRFMHGQYN